MLLTTSSITNLDISESTNSTVEHHSIFHVLKVFHLLPNLRELDCSHLGVSPKGNTLSIGNRCHELRRVTATCCRNIMCLNGSGFERAPSHSELYVILYPWDMISFESTNNEEAEMFLFMDFRGLESLSIKGATWEQCTSCHDVKHKPNAIPQAALMKMVRNHRSLRWLRSDLSEENLAILKSERPDITFVP